LADNRVWFGKDGNSLPNTKRFLSEINNGVKAKSFWPFKDVGSNDSAKKEMRVLFSESDVFPFPKPSTLIKRAVILGASDFDDIILDFFSGSATTAHAVMQLNAEDGGNRRFILVQLPEMCEADSEAAKAGYANICEIGKERIRRAGAQIKMKQAETADSLNLATTPTPALDTGFRVFKLDTSNLKIWDDSPLVGEAAATRLEERLLGHLDVLVPDRTPDDLVCEVMLKLGRDLCEPVSYFGLGTGKNVYLVGEENKIIICLDLGITPEDADVMAQYAPECVIFAEHCFSGCEAKSNVKLTLRDKGVAMRVL